MIQFSCKDGRPNIVAETRGYGIYLDTDSLIDLAKGKLSRRARFINLLQAKGTLLFSMANAIEVAGPLGRSADAVRSFLDSIGPHWIPLELDPWKVMKREQAGLTAEAVVSTELMEGYFKSRICDIAPAAGVIDLSSTTFFRLGAVVDWVHEQRDMIRAKAKEFDNGLRALLEKRRTDYEKVSESLDIFLPSVQFDDRFPMTFALVHLQRLLIKEAKGYQFKSHDGLDFHHATLASAYGSVITLDKQWKRRIKALPTPNGLARTYYRNELDELLATMEVLRLP